MEKENPNTKRIQKQDLELWEQDGKQGNPQTTLGPLNTGSTSHQIHDSATSFGTFNKIEVLINPFTQVTCRNLKETA